VQPPEPAGKTAELSLGFCHNLRSHEQVGDQGHDQ